jgi:hypothetical protein
MAPFSAVAKQRASHHHAMGPFICGQYYLSIQSWGETLIFFKNHHWVEKSSEKKKNWLFSLFMAKKIEPKEN